MNTFTHKRQVSGRQGFTLLEILLVVGLLALLAAFVVPALTSQSDKAKVNLAKAAIGPNGPLSSAINLFKLNTGIYPEELKYLFEKPSDDAIAKNWTACIENESGLQDPWGHEFQYNAKGQHNEDKYDLWSWGPDGKDGTDDDVVNWKTDR